MSPSLSLRLLGGDAVDDLVVDRHAEGRRVAPIAEEGRAGPPFFLKKSWAMRSSSLVVVPGTAACSRRSSVSTTRVQARCMFWSSAQDFWTLTRGPPRCRCSSAVTSSIGPEAVHAMQPAALE